MQYENARDMDVTANFDGVSFPGAKFKVHGGAVHHRPVFNTLHAHPLELEWTSLSVAKRVLLCYI